MYTVYIINYIDNKYLRYHESYMFQITTILNIYYTHYIYIYIYIRCYIINQEVKKLLEDGLAYEPRPGIVRYLG